MINVCKEEGVSTGIFLLFLAVGFIVMGYVNIFFGVCEGQLRKILGFIFSDDKEKYRVDFFDVGTSRIFEERERERERVTNSVFFKYNFNFLV